MSDHLKAYALVAFLLAGAVLVLPAVPSATAQVTASGTFHVGPNILRSATLSTTGPAGWAVSGSGCQMTVLCSTDGNLSSYTYFVANAFGGFSNSCGNFANTTYTFPAPRVVDALHFRAAGQQVNDCVRFYGVLGGTTTLLDSMSGGSIVERWTNFTPASYDSLRISYGVNSGSSMGSLTLYELGLFNKNETTYSFAESYSDALASSAEGLPANAAAANFASSTYALPVGTYYVAVAGIVNKTTGYADPMQVSPTGSGLANVSAIARGRVLSDYSALRTCGVTIWQVTNAQAGQLVTIKPESANVATTGTVCRFTRFPGIFSGTLATWRIQADLAAWGGSASDTWALVYQANTYPFVPVSDEDLNPATTALFNEANVSPGLEVLAAGTVGGQFTTALNLYPDTWVGNGLYMILGQALAAAGNSSAYSILVNGHPAARIGDGESGGYEWAVFYLDDVAKRFGIENANGSVGQGSRRPFAAESYQITIRGGFDPAYGVRRMTLRGADGHTSLACYVVCYSNVQSSATLPSGFTNNVRFRIVNTSGEPIEGVRVRLVNNSTQITTNAAGYANWTNVFADSRFQISKAGYQNACLSYFFQMTDGSTTWVERRRVRRCPCAQRLGQPHAAHAGRAGSRLEPHSGPR